MLELEKGTQLAERYTLAQRLGGDADTAIWLAKDKLTSASVALKITSNNGANVAQLRAEWQASIRLMHAHIVRAFEFHEEADRAFYSQQFIDGPDMGSLAGLHAEEVLGPVGLVAGALAYLHEKGVVHRDIKASNILLDQNGAPYICDFGVAARIGDTASGGSPIAQSPQSIVGDPVAASDDVFALGTLMFELLSGRPPWPADAVERHITAASPPPLIAADGSELADEIIVLVSEMLNRDAALRPTAGQVVERLAAAGYAAKVASIAGAARVTPVADVVESVETIKHVRSVGAGTSSPVEESGSGVSRLAVGLSLAVLVALLAGVIFLLPDSVDDRRVAPAAPQTVDETSDEPIVAEELANEATPERSKVYVDPNVRKRVRESTNLPSRTLDGDDDITFSENDADFSGLDGEARERFNAESTLGELLSAFEVLELRGVERWAPREYRSARDLYADGDAAYLEKDFLYAEELYLGSLTILEPLYDKIEPTFDAAYKGAVAAFEAGDRLESLRLYELAVAITPNHPGAQAGYERARNLEAVLGLVEQGLDYEKDLDLVAAQTSFEQAVELDPLWEPAQQGIVRVQQTRTKIEFDTRMSEGFEALLVEDFLAARAAFRVAQQLIPSSSEPLDGLLQVEQGLRLRDITTLEQEAASLQQDEHWEAVAQTYEEILKIDNTLIFASEGLRNATEMSALHKRLDDLIEEPDQLSVPSVMQSATQLVVSVTTRSDVGPRLASQRDELSRLLRRAATPLPVSLVSDNVTDVSIYKVGRLGPFMRKELSLRPGTYVAVGSRPGFRDVRLEFRVAPEIESEPVIVQCEEQI